MDSQFHALTSQEMKDSLKAPKSPLLIPAALRYAPIERSREMSVHTKYPIDTTDMVFMIDVRQDRLMWGRQQNDWLHYNFVATAVRRGSAAAMYFSFVIPSDANNCGSLGAVPGTMKFLEFEGLVAEVNAPGKVPGLFFYNFDSVRVVAFDSAKFASPATQKEAKK